MGDGVFRTGGWFDEITVGDDDGITVGAIDFKTLSID